MNIFEARMVPIRRKAPGAERDVDTMIEAFEQRLRDMAGPYLPAEKVAEVVVVTSIVRSGSRVTMAGRFHLRGGPVQRRGLRARATS